MILGLTGSIGSGKSTVTKALEELGAAIFRADEAAREVVLPGSPAYEELSTHFGSEIAPPGGPLQRRKLARQVFASSEDRARLESIIHPRVRELEHEFIRRHQSNPLVVLEIPLLYETGAEALCDQVLVVWCDDEVRRERLERDRGMTREEIDERLAAQMPQDEKRRRADHEIDNSGELNDTLNQAKNLYQRLTSVSA